MDYECTKCCETKPADQFYVQNGKPRRWCKACYREWHRERYVPKNGATDDARECGTCGKTYQPKNRRPSRYCSRECSVSDRDPRHTRDLMLQRRYGISLEDFERMLAGQNGGCAICGASSNSGPGVRSGPGATLHVDHCHTTGKVRGILCDVCNHALGKFKDDPARFDSAAAYLRRALS